MMDVIAIIYLVYSIMLDPGQIKNFPGKCDTPVYAMDIWIINPKFQARIRCS